MPGAPWALRGVGTSFFGTEIHWPGPSWLPGGQETIQASVAWMWGGGLNGTSVASRIHDWARLQDAPRPPLPAVQYPVVPALGGVEFCIDHAPTRAELTLSHAHIGRGFDYRAPTEGGAFIEYASVGGDFASVPPQVGAELAPAPPSTLSTRAPRAPRPSCGA